MNLSNLKALVTGIVISIVKTGKAHQVGSDQTQLFTANNMLSNFLHVIV